jgi:hypothetical protein
MDGSDDGRSDQLVRPDGQVRPPWADAGYDCYCVDIQHRPGEVRLDNITFVGADIRDWRPPRQVVNRVAFISSFSPCDDAACSGARWFRGKGPYALARSIELFAIGRDWIEWFGAPGFCEHPRSTISTYYRPADYKFSPFEFTALEPADNYTKETWIWGYNGFVMPRPEQDSSLPPPDDRIHKCPPGPERKNFRSATPMGFARATFQANARRHQRHPASH